MERSLWNLEKEKNVFAKVLCALALASVANDLDFQKNEEFSKKICLSCDLSGININYSILVDVIKTLSDLWNKKYEFYL